MPQQAAQGVQRNIHFQYQALLFSYHHSIENIRVLGKHKQAPREQVLGGHVMKSEVLRKLSLLKGPLNALKETWQCAHNQEWQHNRDPLNNPWLKRNPCWGLECDT